MDNVFVERLWRSPKSEDVYLKGYADGHEARRGIAEWIAFYNQRRPHQALDYQTPIAVWREAIAGAGAMDMMDNASALPTCHSRRSRRSLSLRDREEQRAVWFPTRAESVQVVSRAGSSAGS
jgi:hypothetical protein